MRIQLYINKSRHWIFYSDRRSIFGSRARGDARPDSDWDLLAVVADAVPPIVTEPMLAWQLSRTADVPVTLLVTRRSDLAAIWNLPNTIGNDLAREGVKLRVG